MIFTELIPFPFSPTYSGSSYGKIYSFDFSFQIFMTAAICQASYNFVSTEIVCIITSLPFDCNNLESYQLFSSRFQAAYHSYTEYSLQLSIFFHYFMSILNYSAKFISLNFSAIFAYFVISAD